MFIFNGLKAAVTISGSVGVGCMVPAANQTLRNQFSEGTTTTGKVSVLTVTAGKTYYLHGMILDLRAAEEVYFANGSDVYVLHVSDAVRYHEIFFTSPIAFTDNIKIKGLTGGKDYSLTLFGHEE